MEISLKNYRERFHELVLRFLWRQWSVLGISGHASSSEQWIIDPEALLLFSTVAARRDARLFDEMLDWLEENGSWINLQRLSRMQTEHTPGDASVLAAIAAHLCCDSAHGKWKVLTQKTFPSRSPSEATPLFPGIPVLGELDRNFSQWGWTRGLVRSRGLSQPPRTDQPGCFLIKLRALFGRQSRAECIAWLLAHESGHPAEMARQLGYFPRSLQAVLNELTLSGHVRAMMAGREKHFAIQHADWRFLLTWKDAEITGFPKWMQWSAFFCILRRLYDLFERPEIETMSAHLQAIEVKRAFDLDDLVKAGLPVCLTHLPSRTGSEFVTAALLAIEAFLGGEELR